MGYNDMRVAAVIPIKALAEAKSRLASVLSAAERADLALWMLGRVLRAVAASQAVNDVLVVTPDRRVLEWVGQFALDVPDARRLVPVVGEQPSLADGDHEATESRLNIAAMLQESGDLNEALELGRRAALARQACGLVVLPGDLPLLQPREVRDLVRMGTRDSGGVAGSHGRQPGVLVVAPDRLGTGTNALFLAPPEAVPFAFGAESRARHETLARERGLRVAIYRSKGVAFDVDGPEDLARLDSRDRVWHRDHGSTLSAGGRAHERSAG